MTDLAYLFVSPPLYIALGAGEQFNLAINISSAEYVQSAQLTLSYNITLLKVLYIDQGAFFPPSPNASFFYEINEYTGAVKANISMAYGEDSIKGNGTLAWIFFEAMETLDSCAWCPIELTETSLLRPDSSPISHAVAGALIFWGSLQPDPPPAGRLVDAYTQKAGQGLSNFGGVFALNETVELISQVTYNNDPVQHVLVAFAILNPEGEIILVRVIPTNEDGFAETSFRIPSLPSNTGTWQVVSSTSIACTTVWDTLAFRVYPEGPVGGHSCVINYVNSPVNIYFVILASILFGFVLVRRRRLFF